MQKLSFVRQFEKYSPKVNAGAGADTLTLFLDFPVVLQDIQGKNLAGICRFGTAFGDIDDPAGLADAGQVRVLRKKGSGSA